MNQLLTFFSTMTTVELCELLLQLEQPMLQHISVAFRFWTAIIALLIFSKEWGCFEPTLSLGDFTGWGLQRSPGTFGVNAIAV